MKNNVLGSDDELEEKLNYSIAMPLDVWLKNSIFDELDDDEFFINFNDEIEIILK